MLTPRQERKQLKELWPDGRDFVWEGGSDGEALAAMKKMKLEDAGFRFWWMDEEDGSLPHTLCLHVPADYLLETYDWPLGT